MIYLKSVAVGLLAFSVMAVVYVVILFSYLLRKYPPPPGAEVAIDIRGVITGPLFWVITLAAFALGFWLVYRRHA
jgi:hypothetical protein